MSEQQTPTPLADFWATLLASYPRSTRFPGEHRCPRVGFDPGPSPGLACWQNDETCSYCGSLHPDLFMERLEAGDVILEPTDKDYKVYIKAAPGAAGFLQSFRADGSPGGNDPSKWQWTTRPMDQAKFYFYHLSGSQKQRFVELLNAKKLRLDVPGYFYRLPFFIRYDKPA